MRYSVMIRDLHDKSNPDLPTINYPFKLLAQLDAKTANKEYQFDPTLEFYVRDNKTGEEV